MTYVWLALIIVAVAVEACTAQLLSIWFVAGGLAALIAALCHAELWLQIVLFVAVTALALLATRPLVKKMLRFQKTDTNADRYVGKEGIVTAAIDNIAGTGQSGSGIRWRRRRLYGT